MTVPSAPLCVVPTFLRTGADLDLAVRCLVSLWSTAPHAGVLIVDNASPEPALVQQLAVAASELGHDIVALDETGSVARAVNVGLAHALETGRDAVLVNAGIEFADPAWLDRMLGRTDTAGRPAAVVGAWLVDPSGCIRHAGMLFSVRTRTFWHRCRHAPANLPEALDPLRCPVAVALQLIRYETLATIGLYDEGFGGSYADVDYCLRVFAAGRDCIYEPAAWAVEHATVLAPESDPVREASHQHLIQKWLGADFTAFTPAIV